METTSVGHFRVQELHMGIRGAVNCILLQGTDRSSRSLDTLTMMEYRYHHPC